MFHCRLSRLLLAILVLAVSQSLAEFDHDDQNCVDVSIWGDVKYQDATCRICKQEFERECSSRDEYLCVQVPTTSCTLVGYHECEMISEVVTFQETKIITDGTYVPYVCENITRIEPHIKLEPRCRNVTRQDCVTKWELTSDGRKVWAGNELCRPVTWMKCELVEVPKDFEQTYTECKTGSDRIPTMGCRDEPTTKRIMKTVCQAKTAMNCQCINEEQCVTVTYEECSEKLKPASCETETIGMTPYQDKIHRVKCLLQDSGAAPDLDVDQSDRSANSKLDVAGGGLRGGGRREARDHQDTGAEPALDADETDRSNRRRRWVKESGLLDIISGGSFQGETEN